MRSLRTFGLLAFLVGFGLFIGSFFDATYTVSKSDITSLEIGAKTDILQKHAGKLIDKKFSNPMQLATTIGLVLDDANRAQLETHGITEVDIKKIIDSGTNLTFVSSNGTDIFSNRPLLAEKFIAYSSWMDGKQFESKQELKSALQNIADNINKYEVLTQFGFDRYLVKSIKYDLARAGLHSRINDNKVLWLIIIFGFSVVGGLIYNYASFSKPAGIKNDGIFKSALKNRGWLGILLGTFLIAFYIVLYYYPEYMVNWIALVDPVSIFLKGSPAGRFFLYGFLYTLAILVMGVRMIAKYRHSNYQMVRTASVMFFQLAFAFLIPEILLRLNQPYFDFKNIWPLDYDFFFDYELNNLIQSGNLGIFMLVWGIALAIIVVPVMVYFFGKRWYCSWVCGCGGLAETLGDPYRHLSDKSLRAWKIERWMVYPILGFAIVMTAGVLYTFFTGESNLLGFINTYSLRETYGLWIGSAFAGVVGTGFYPLMGNRVWCRFGCPLAAYLGIIQRFKSRFRITTNGGQCISCGNCSTYCEMGIDVRAYAQKGENIVRASCVGCGVCASVCPRGVLKLENGSESTRFVHSIAYQEVELPEIIKR